MKKLENSGDTHIDASYTRDPTKQSQRKGFKKKQFKPKSQPDSKRPDGKKSCIWCKEDIHSRDKCPAKDATCRFCDKQGHFDRACLKKKGQGKDMESKHQHAVDVTRDQDSSEYDDDFDLGAVSINAVENRKSCKVFAPVVFHSKGNSSSSLKVTGKVDTTVLALVFRSHVCCLDLKAVSSVIRSQ